MTSLRWIFLVSCLLLATLASNTVTAADNESYLIESMRDNVYRFTAGHYRSVFMVTDAGIFVTDPINPKAAAWLKQELQQRFPVPIRYLAYSHNHVDHTLGGEQLATSGVSVIAQELAAEDIINTRLPTAIPDITFKDQLKVSLGDSSVTLQYYGSNNGRGSVSMHFMPANVLYVVDWIVLGRMPYRDLQGYDIQGMIHSTQEVLTQIPFALFIGGHAEAGSKQDVQRYLDYLQALYASVRDGMLQGKALTTLQQEIRLPNYADLPMYQEWLPENIAGVHRMLLDQSYFNFRPDIQPSPQ